MTDTTSPTARTPAIAPGRLRNWVEMTIQTRQAQRLVRGRRGGEGKPPIIGLYRYGAMTRTLWSGASRDDPYADWGLLQIEQALEESKAEVKQLRSIVEQDMTRVSAMRIGLAQSLAPTKIELTFSNPYGYMGGWLLIEMDELVLSTLTARHVGLLKRDESERLLSEAGRAVRRAFASAQGYRVTAVTRQDIRESNRRAQRAIQAMGELPQNVIDGTLRAEHAPTVGPLAPSSTGSHPVATDQDDDAADADDPDHKDDADVDGADH